MVIVAAGHDKGIGKREDSGDSGIMEFAILPEPRAVLELVDVGTLQYHVITAGEDIC